MKESWKKNFVKDGDRLSSGGVAKGEDFPELAAATDGFGGEGAEWE